VTVQEELDLAFQEIGAQVKSLRAASSTSGTLTTFEHGSNASAIRPTTQGSLIWIGTVQPLNWLASDIWANPNGAVVYAPPTSGLVAHYVASDLVDGAVASWPNKVSGGLAMAQTTAGLQPVKSTLDGRAFVTFDGVDDYLGAAMNGPAINTSAIVVRMKAVSASRTIVGTSSGLHTLNLSSTSQWNMHAGTSLSSGITAGTLRTVVVNDFNGASSQQHVGTVSGPVGNAGTTARTGLRFGANSSLANLANMEVYEFVMYNRLLTVDERTAFVSAMTSKYAL